VIPGGRNVIDAIDAIDVLETMQAGVHLLAPLRTAGARHATVVVLLVDPICHRPAFIEVAVAGDHDAPPLLVVVNWLPTLRN